VKTGKKVTVWNCRQSATSWLPRD